jgi:hypothetical protein
MANAKSSAKERVQTFEMPKEVEELFQLIVDYGKRARQQRLARSEAESPPDSQLFNYQPQQPSGETSLISNL